MCRVHELEADKMALQSERLVRQHELRRRDLAILRYDRQRQLSEEIITRQRQLIEGDHLRMREISNKPLKFHCRRQIKTTTRFTGDVSNVPTGNSRFNLR